MLADKEGTLADLQSSLQTSTDNKDSTTKELGATVLAPGVAVSLFFSLRPGTYGGVAVRSLVPQMLQMHPQLPTSARMWLVLCMLLLTQPAGAHNF